jgi:hypothetical protein
MHPTRTTPEPWRHATVVSVRKQRWHWDRGKVYQETREGRDAAGAVFIESRAEVVFQMHPL